MKKFFIASSVLLTALSASAQQTVLFGDYNNDGKITVADITYMANIFMGKTNNTILSGNIQIDGSSSNVSTILFGDYNNDGKITSEDFNAMMNISLTQKPSTVISGDFAVQEYEGPKQAPAIVFNKSAISNETIEYKTTFTQFYELLSNIQMSKLEFLENYEPVCYENKDVLCQFLPTISEDKVIDYVPCAWKNTYTEVRCTTDNESANSVLSFELDQLDQSYIYEKTGHKDIIYVAFKRRGTTIVDLFIPLEFSIKEKEFVEYARINNNYYWTDKNGEQYLRFNVNWPLDNSNTYESNDQQTFWSELASSAEPVKGIVRDINDLWEMNAPRFSNNAYKIGQQPIYYFHPQNKNITIIDKMTDSTYMLDVDYNDLYSSIWINGEGPTAKTAEEAKSHKVTNYISYNSADFVKIAELNHLIDTRYGIYNNIKLYAVKPGEPHSDENCIAELNRYTGKIHYRYNERSKTVLNAADYFPAYVGIFLPDQNGIMATPINYDLITNNIINIHFARPISVESTACTVMDNGSASYISILDKFSFKDWRGYDFIDYSQSNPYNNIWLYAYYGLNEITVDFANATINLGGETMFLSNLSSFLRFSYVGEDKITLLASNDSSTGLVGKKSMNLIQYNEQSAGTQLNFDTIIKSSGYIKYQNNAANIMTCDVTIPVTFSYDWGKIMTQLNITITSGFDK